MNNSKFQIGAAVLSLVLTGAVIGGIAAHNNMIYGQIPFITYAQYNTLNCGKYSTNIENNISYENILSTVPEKDNYINFNGTVAADLSDIVDSISATKGQFYHQESGKTGYDSWKFGSSSAAGSLTITLNRNINAIGFYAVAYANANDVGKYLQVNNTLIDQPLIAAETFNINNADQRFFVEFDSPVSEVTIAANTAKNNRFYLYSVGFYTLNLN